MHVDDDYDEEEEEEEEITPQVVQPAVQQVLQTSPIPSDPPAVIADELADSSDSANEVINESDAKDPQQAAIDQAATINNSIDPVGSEAIVDDEEDDGEK